MSERSSGEVRCGEWALLSVLVLFFTVAYVDRTILALMVDPVRRGLKLDDVQISLLIGLAFASAYALAGVPIGWLVDRFSRRWTVFGGLLFWGAATAACGLARDFTQLFVLRVLVGMGEATLMPSAHSMISDSFPRARLTGALSIFSLGTMIGAGVSLIVGGAVINSFAHRAFVEVPLLGPAEPWRVVFFCTGIPGLFLASLILLFREPTRQRSVGDRLRAPTISMMRFLRKHWQIWVMFTVVFGGMNICNAALLFWQPTYMSRFFHWNAAQYGLGLGLTYAIAGAAGLVFSGWAVDRLWSRGVRDAPLRYYLWALLISTPFVVYALLSRNVWIYLGLIWIAKFATVNFLGLGSAAVQLTTPSELRGRMAALFTTVIISLVGSSLGASIPALITRAGLHGDQSTGQSIAITIVICVPLAVGAILWGAPSFRKAVDEAELRESRALT